MKSDGCEYYHEGDNKRSNNNWYSLSKSHDHPVALLYTVRGLTGLWQTKGGSQGF